MKIVALNGLLGYGYDRSALYKAFEEKVDYLGVDAGSVDPGPYYLGSGNSFTERGAVKRDLEDALLLAIKNKTPFIIGTAGGSGSMVHVNWLRDIVKEVADEKGLKFKLGLIYTDVDKGYIIKKIKTNKVIPLGKQLKLDENQVQKSVRLVSQIGVAPFIEMLKAGVDVIIAGRACDTAIYAAPCILNGFDSGLAFHMAKIMECGALCADPAAASDVMQGYIRDTYFELRPPNPLRRCTTERVAAHTMYEQSNPYYIYEPDGVVDLRKSIYEQVDERTVRIKNSKFKESEKKTLKIEGVRSAGFRTICIGEIKDPYTILRIDELFRLALVFVHENIGGGISKEDFSVRLRKYGDTTSGTGIGIIIDVVGKTQQIADTVCTLVRSKLLHSDYGANEITPRRKSTAGNIAFPFSPSDIHMGEVFEFNVYHLVEVEDLSETAETVVEDII